MLQKIRKAADSTIFKICLGILVISFVLGVADFLKGGNAEDLATFKDIDPISYADFAEEKASEIKRIQKSEGISYSEEQIAELGIDQMIMSRMIQAKLLSFLVQKYDLDFSDSMIAEVIKSLPAFRDEDNTFNIDRFKNYLRANNTTEEQHANQVYDYLSSNIIMSSFVGNAHVSKLRIDNVIDYMSEIRNVDIASISLKSSKDNKIKPKDSDLLAFYEENKDDFKTPEIRDICYAKFDDELVKAKAKVTDSEISKFYEDNKEEFGDQKLSKLKDEIRGKIYKQKISQHIIDLSKSLEDEVAGGSSLGEIGSKYGLKTSCEKNLTFENIETRSDGIFANFIPQLSAMGDKEVSYPLDLPDNKGIILFEITKIIPEGLQSFDSVKAEVTSKYYDFTHRQKTMKILQDLASGTSSSEFASSATANGMSVTHNKSFIRANLSEGSKESPEMLLSIFSAERDKIIGPFVWEDRAYIAIVRKIDSDTATKAKLSKTSSNNITNKIRDGIIEELLSHAQSESKMKVKVNFSTKNSD